MAVPPTKQQLSKFEKLLIQLSLLAMLATGGTDALAIGDSSGCGVDREYTRKLALGTVSEIEAYISTSISRRLEYLNRQKRRPFADDPTALQAWKDEIRNNMLRQPVYCSHGEFPLDYAVANGNLDVVRWLLDMGVDPNAASRSTAGKNGSIFSRCGFGYHYSDRRDGLTKEQARQQEIEAYRMLLTRGANINDPDPFNSIWGCLSEEMYPILKQLGARVTVKAFRSWVQPPRAGGGHDSKWTVAQELAKGQSFDLRGTAFEYDLLFRADFRADMPDYESVIELIRRFSTLARVSPGIIPGQPASQTDVPRNFSPVRERCYFPEISAYPNLEFVALVRQEKNGESSYSQDVTEIRVGKTKEPVLLAVINERDTPTKWVIRRSKEAYILGVMVLTGAHRDRDDRDVLSFDPLRPAFFGRTYHCSVRLERGRDGMNGNRRIELRLDGRANPATHTFDPFKLPGLPPVTVSENAQFLVGDISPSSILISWPESLRIKSAASEK